VLRPQDPDQLLASEEPEAQASFTVGLDVAENPAAHETRVASSAGESMGGGSSSPTIDTGVSQVSTPGATGSSASSSRGSTSRPPHRRAEQAPGAELPLSPPQVVTRIFED
jgi:hypothetical protein